MISPYLDQPLIPLTVALSGMLEKIETELASETAGAAEKWRLRQRAELVRRLLTSGRHAGDDERVTRAAGTTRARPPEPDPVRPA